MFVAVAGLEPALLDISTSFSTDRCSTMLNYTAYRMYLVIIKQAAVRQSAYQAAMFGLVNYSSVRSFISSYYAGSFGTIYNNNCQDLHYYLSAFSMLVQHVNLADSEITIVPSAVLTDSDRLFHSLRY